MSDGLSSANGDDNIELVQAFFTALPKDLPQAVDRYGGDAITWKLPPTVPGGSRPWEGKVAVMKFLGMMQDGFAPGSMQLLVHEIIGSGRRFALRVSIEASSVTGLPYQNDYAFFVTCENGKITEVEEYVDSAKVLSIFG